MNTITKFAICVAATFLLASTVIAQKTPRYSYTAQKRFIPVELGQVYIGMPFKEFASKVDLRNAEANDRFEPLELTIPLAKGNVTELTVRIHGLSADEKAAVLEPGTAVKKGLNGEAYNAEVKRVRLDAVPARGVVYAMYVGFRPDFDLRAYTNKIYGPGEVRKTDDPYKIYDTQWTKKTTDGLTWIIRAFYEGDNRSLQLLGVVPGTEWDPGA